MEIHESAALQNRIEDIAGKAKDLKKAIRRHRVTLRILGEEMSGLRDQLAAFDVELIIEPQSEGRPHGSRNTTPRRDVI